MNADRLYRVNGLVEKPLAEDAPSDVAVLGRYIINPAIFDILENIQPGKGGEIQLTDALQVLAQQETMYAYHFQGSGMMLGTSNGGFPGLSVEGCGAGESWSVVFFIVGDGERTWPDVGGSSGVLCELFHNIKGYNQRDVPSCSEGEWNCVVAIAYTDVNNYIDCYSCACYTNIKRMFLCGLMLIESFYLRNHRI
jgi:hypothetical protein